MARKGSLKQTHEFPGCRLILSTSRRGRFWTLDVVGDKSHGLEIVDIVVRERIVDLIRRHVGGDHEQLYQVVWGDIPRPAESEPDQVSRRNESCPS